MSDYLKTVTEKANVALYQIISPDGQIPHLRRFIVSTPQTRDLCNDPLITGQSYEDLLTKAISNTVELPFFRDEITSLDPHGLIVLYILSGGLNFNLQRPLDRLGLRCTITMQSEQRLRKPDGRWEIYKNSYAKKHIPKFHKKITVFSGDVCASGKSLSYGLGFQIAQFIGSNLKDEILGDLYRTTDGTLSTNERITLLFDNACDPANPERIKIRDTLLERIRNVKTSSMANFDNKLPFSELYFFTIGGHRAEIVLENYIEILTELFPETFGDLTVIYFEDRFDCIHKRNDALNISGTINFGTDLLRRKNHLPSPEYEKAVFSKTIQLFHRCSIYDCGSRRFDWHFHLADLIQYFANCVSLGKNSMKAIDLINEKYSLAGTGSEDEYITHRKKIWPDLEKNRVADIYKTISSTLEKANLESPQTLIDHALDYILLILEHSNYRRGFSSRTELKQFISLLLNSKTEVMRKRIKQYNGAFEAVNDILPELVHRYFSQ